MSTRPARIGLDYTPAWEQGAGIGRSVRELVAALAVEDQTRDWRLFVAGARMSQLPRAPGANFHWCPVALSSRWLMRIWHRAQLPLPVELITGPLTLYHATDFVLPPVRRHTTTIVQVHDLSFLRVPEAAPPALIAWLERMVPASVRRADHVLAVSHATRQDLIDLFGVVPHSKVSVLHSGVDSRFRPMSAVDQQAVRRKYGLGDWPFILSVGTMQPRKNFGRIVTSLARLRENGHDLHLVIAGGQGWLSDPFHEQLRDSGIGDFVHLVGYVADEDLPALYSAARVFAFPSLYEGFGFPVLEAMACGVPVVTSNLSSLPEVAGDAALLIDPYDSAALADALERLVVDNELRRQLVLAGHAQAGRFTWARTARELLQVYQSLGAMA